MLFRVLRDFPTLTSMGRELAVLSVQHLSPEQDNSANSANTAIKFALVKDKCWHFWGPADLSWPVLRTKNPLVQEISHPNAQIVVWFTDHIYVSPEDKSFQIQRLWAFQRISPWRQNHNCPNKISQIAITLAEHIHLLVDILFYRSVISKNVSWKE